MICVSTARHRTDEQPEQIPQGQPIGYTFDPIPSAIRGDRRIKPIDQMVLAILISFAIWRRDSCWAAVATIAARLPALRIGPRGFVVASHRTVQRSLERLKTAGYIRHQRVAKPDPDDPRNMTGWRFFFEFAPVACPAPSPDSRMPNKSGDALVTQDQREVLEQEQITLNVANESDFAGREEGQGQGAEDSVFAHELAANPDERPIEEPLIPATPSLPEASAAWTPRELAVDFRSRMRDRGLLLKPTDDGHIRVEAIPSAVPPAPIEPDEVAKLLQLKPEILAVLRGEVKVPAGPPAVSKPEALETAKPRPAPQVRNPGRVHSLLGQLARNSDSTIEAVACRALAEALGDQKPASLKLFLGLVGDVRRGNLPEGCLQEAFDAACGKKVGNRGAMFTYMVKRWRQSARGGRMTPG